MMPTIGGRSGWFWRDTHKLAHPDLLGGTVTRFVLVWIDGPYPRPESDKVEIICAPKENVVILWPAGLTMREAILAWAQAEGGGRTEARNRVHVWWRRLLHKR